MTLTYLKIIERLLGSIAIRRAVQNSQNPVNFTPSFLEQVLEAVPRILSAS